MSNEDFMKYLDTREVKHRTLTQRTCEWGTDDEIALCSDPEGVCDGHDFILEPPIPF
jgi:hypothetical protein